MEEAGSSDGLGSRDMAGVKGTPRPPPAAGGWGCSGSQLCRERLAARAGSCRPGAPACAAAVFHGPYECSSPRSPDPWRGASPLGCAFHCRLLGFSVPRGSHQGPTSSPCCFSAVSRGLQKSLCLQAGCWELDPVVP